MTDRDSTLRAALAELVRVIGNRHFGRMPEEVQTAYDAARAALAQPEPCRGPNENGHCRNWPFTCEAKGRDCAAPPPPAPAQPEPVAWQQRYIDPQEGPSTWQPCDENSRRILQGRADYELRPLYAAPPLPAPEQPALSDEQIEKMAHRMAWRYKHSSDPHHSSTYTFNLCCVVDFARAIERTLKGTP